MALTLLFLSSLTLTPKHSLSFESHLPCDSRRPWKIQRKFRIPSVAWIPYQPINVDYLEEEFSGHGVSFEGVGDSCIAKMRMENRSTATLMLPSGLITSYKAHMWHGGRTELLQTSVLEGKDGNPVIQGGVSLAFKFGNEDGDSWSPSSWVLRHVRGNPKDSIEVELMSTDAEDNVEVKHILSLTEDTLSSQIVVSNTKSSKIELVGSLISHLTVSTPEATYAFGLEGSNFFSRPILFSNFSIVPPDLGRETGLTGLFSSWAGFNPRNSYVVEAEEEIEGEEDENYKQLTQEMSRIYTSAPRDFTIIDRGRRNSIVVGREGFEEVYVYSPGSHHESYGMYSYICVGQSAMLKPVILNPGEQWTGLQYLHNPNL